MSFWDEQAGFDIRDRKHPDKANAGRNMGGTTTRKAPSGIVWADGMTRYVCAYCGGKFDAMTVRTLHELTDHEGEAA
ncbi:MAG: hypothetical protein NUW01_18405 [Gemmatimonadaceae bacterium]|nr:hypothetical protein [Gemmatimonadaceae bacterium]